MKIPKYIEKALIERANAAIRFNQKDWEIYKFLENHNIQVQDYDILGGCESIVNPVDSANRICKAIIEKE